MIYRKIEEGENKIQFNKELGEEIIDLIRFELDKLAFLESAKWYFNVHGLRDLNNIITQLIRHCNISKSSFKGYLLNHDVEIPELSISKLDPSFESITEPFEIFIEFEKEFFGRVHAIVEKAVEVKDFFTVSYFLPILNKPKFGEKLLNCVKEGEDPNKIFEYCEEDYPL